MATAGNRTSPPVQAQCSLAFDADNRITGSGPAYDAAGHLTYDGTNSYTYDAEGRIATVPNLGTTYVYDAEGRRAAIIASTGSGSCGTPPQIYYIFDLADHVVSQQCPGGRMREEFYAAGRHLVNYGLLVTFMHPDWLGTEHYRTQANGSVYGQCVNGPFGDQMYCGEAGGDYSPVHFTAKERDGGNTLSPTNLDNFGARFYSSSLARFMSPDWAAKPTAVPYASFGNPQSLNLYSYVKNNPVTTRDPDGHQEQDETEKDTEATRTEDRDFNERMTEAGRELTNEHLDQQFGPRDKFIENLKANGGDDPLTGMCYAPAADRTANDPVRRDSSPNRYLKPDPEGKGAPHNQLGTRESKSQPGTNYRQAIEYNKDGNPVRRTDFTDHGRPGEHTNPHYHEIDPNTQKIGPAKPLPKLPGQGT